MYLLITNDDGKINDTTNCCRKISTILPTAVGRNQRHYQLPWEEINNTTNCCGKKSITLPTAVGRNQRQNKTAVERSQRHYRLPREEINDTTNCFQRQWVQWWMRRECVWTLSWKPFTQCLLFRTPAITKSSLHKFNWKQSVWFGFTVYTMWLGFSVYTMWLLWIVLCSIDH